MSKMYSPLFLAFFVSACTAQDLNYENIEGWNPEKRISTEWCDPNTGVTNKGNSCYWIPGGTQKNRVRYYDS